MKEIIVLIVALSVISILSINNILITGFGTIPEQCLSCPGNFLGNAYQGNRFTKTTCNLSSGMSDSMHLFSASLGTMVFNLTGPGNCDYDIYVYGHKGCSSQLLSVYSDTSACNEEVSQFVSAGSWYTVRVEAKSGSGPAKVNICLNSGSDTACPIECINDPDCDDDDECTIDECSGTPEVCAHTPILNCTSNDGCCPNSCDFNIDNDCPFPMIANIISPDGEIFQKSQTININTYITDNGGNPLAGATTTIKNKLNELPDIWYFWDACTDTSDFGGWCNCSRQTNINTTSGWYDVRIEASKTGYNNTIATKTKAYFINESVLTCNDGTALDQCSISNPKYCQDGVLVDDCQLCGCLSGITCRENGSCTETDVCGDGFCDVDENNCTCPLDCGDCSGICDTCIEYRCVNSNCVCSNITIDCCGNGLCEANETYLNCSVDCAPYTCGNSICEAPNETYSKCCLDCACPSGQACQNNECVDEEDEGPASGTGPSPITPAPQPEPPQNVTRKIISISPGQRANITIEEANVSVKEVHIEVNNPVKDVEITVVKFPKKPAKIVKEVVGKVYEYLELNLENATENDVKKTTMGFRVRKMWLTENKINKSSVKLNRYRNDSWHKMPTLLIGESPEFVYYEAQVPGFSYFAITGEETEAPETPVICIVDERRCVGNNLEKCNADGISWSIVETCRNGCNSVTLSCNPPPAGDTSWYYIVISVVVVAVIAVVYLMNKRFKKPPKTLEEALDGVHPV